MVGFVVFVVKVLHFFAYFCHSVWELIWLFNIDVFIIATQITGLRVRVLIIRVFLGLFWDFKVIHLGLEVWIVIIIVFFFIFPNLVWLRELIWVYWVIIIAGLQSLYFLFFNIFVFLLHRFFTCFMNGHLWVKYFRYLCLYHVHGVLVFRFTQHVINISLF